MNSQQELTTIHYLVGEMQLPKIEYTVKRYSKWFRYYYSIETNYCKIENIGSFTEAIQMLTSGGIQASQINVDRSCYDYK